MPGLDDSQSCILCFKRTFKATRFKGDICKKPAVFWMIAGDPSSALLCGDALSARGNVENVFEVDGGQQ